MTEPKKKLSEAHRQAIIRGKNTPEGKARASVAQMGNTKKLGKKESEETRRRKSLAHTGKTLSEEHKQHLRESMNTEETLKRISEGVKRAYADPEMKERHNNASRLASQTLEYSQNMSESIRRVQATEEYKANHLAAMNDPDLREKLRNYRLGKPSPVTEEGMKRMKEKLSVKALERWANVPEEVRREHVQKAIDASMSIFISSLEVQVKVLLDALEISYQQQHRIGKYITDFYIASDNLIIEVNGCYWHSCPQCGFTYEPKLESDAKREKYLRDKGYKILTIWEHDLRTEFVEPFLDELFSIE